MGHKTVSDFFRFPVQYVIRPISSQLPNAGSHPAPERILPVERAAGGCTEQGVCCSRGAHHHRIGVEFRRQVHHESFLEE
ncbi:MAG: hypothetical protein U0K32_00875 [Segatella copri]|nr:hypothetical protein [Segatella copri]